MSVDAARQKERREGAGEDRTGGLHPYRLEEIRRQIFMNREVSLLLTEAGGNGGPL